MVGVWGGPIKFFLDLPFEESGARFGHAKVRRSPPQHMIEILRLVTVGAQVRRRHSFGPISCVAQEVSLRRAAKLCRTFNALIVLVRSRRLLRLEIDLVRVRVILLLLHVDAFHLPWDSGLIMARPHCFLRLLSDGGEDSFTITSIVRRIDFVQC